MKNEEKNKECKLLNKRRFYMSSIVEKKQSY